MQKHSLNKAKEAGVPLTYLVDDMTKFETSAVTADGGPVQLALMLFGSAVHLLTNDMGASPTPPAQPVVGTPVQLGGCVHAS